MSDLTNGELRFISESTNGWSMLINNIMAYMDDIPQDVKDKVNSLKDAYKKEFLDFYQSTKDAGTYKDGSDIKIAFEDQWEKKCPEFYQPRKIFEGCDAEEIKKAESAILDAESRLSSNAV